jgi:alanyl-tRNA synthetase
MLTTLSGDRIRQTFLNFYAARQHQILPSASLVPEDPTVLLTIAGMLPFKPIFLGQRPAPSPRATTSQKCIRTNDIENVGRTKRHHTFFEMLGNFSFGDYFKSQAIAWAWEISTEVFQLPSQSLVVSVFEDDDEAFEIWEKQIGVPKERIIRMGEADNFWVSGPTGPCGPCSEIYYDFNPEAGCPIDLEDDRRFIEFYNLVFMQYNRDSEGTLTPLQAQNIDTGMGLERMAQILQGKPNNYETDLMYPLLEKVAELSDRSYENEEETQKISFKVIADHIRAVTHLIADGVTASNLGRGYILRRLIRRVVRHGRLLGINRSFTVEMAEAAIVLMEGAYPNLRERETIIKAELDREENRFLETLDRGEKLLAEIIETAQQQSTKTISGLDAFTLYDTFGFPLELTQEIAEEQGLTVDLEGFEAEMQQQKDRARSAQVTIDLTIQGSLDQLAEQLHPTTFVGYQDLQTESVVQALLVNGETVTTAAAGTDVQVVLEQTPFYGESGGQVGDRGYLLTGETIVRITDVQKESGIFIHFGRIERGLLHTGDRVQASIDSACRRRVQANHSATHLLQAALKAIVDPSISQAGSLVSFDRLRFDFNCPRAITAAELQQIEDQINTWIAEAQDAEIATMPIAEAKAKGAVAMFGEKYGAEVRVIDFPGISMELCGGTHVGNTAEIGAFKIIGEAGIAAGVRRIEAVAGAAVLDYLQVREAVVKDLGDRFKAKPEEICDRVTALQEELKTTQKELAQLKSELAIVKSDSLISQVAIVGDFQVLVAELPGVDAKSLQTAGERLQQKLGDGGAVVLASVLEDGKVSLLAAFGSAVIKNGLQAGKFIGTIAQICGGGGGGRPNLAQAGGRDAAQLPEALAQAQQQLTEKLKA